MNAFDIANAVYARLISLGDAATPDAWLQCATRMEAAAKIAPSTTQRTEYLTCASDCRERALRAPGARLTPCTIPSGSWSPREVLELARKHKIPGQLVDRSHNGRYEIRVYAGHDPRKPWVIIARPEQHFTGEE